MKLPLFAKKTLSIKWRLFLSILSEVMLIIVFGAFLIISSRQIDTITSSESKADQIVQTITEMRFVTFENLLTHSDRSYHQWQTKHQEINTLLDSVTALNNREKILIDEIRTHQRTVEPLFIKLATSYREPASGEDLIIQNQYQERLASQIVSKQQIEITSAIKLSDLKRERAVSIRQQTSSLTVAVIALMFLITAANFIFIYMSITRALNVLQHGAREISKGRLDYRLRVRSRNDEFDELATTFNNMAKALEQTDRIKTEFILLASHQLRTPATAVKGFISLLADYHNENLTPKQKELLTLAYEENNRQIKLINEILAVAQIETDGLMMQKVPVDLVQLAKTVLAEQQVNLDERGQNVELNYSEGLPPVIMADPEKIRIVIENLVHNASKFSPHGASIALDIKRSNSSSEISVSDHGQGIDEADLEKLFKKFSRISSPSTIKTEGAGLGLYLAKQIVELHNGKISVRSKVGKGTTFTVQLPNGAKGA